MPLSDRGKQFKLLIQNVSHLCRFCDSLHGRHEATDALCILSPGDGFNHRDRLQSNQLGGIDHEQRMTRTLALICIRPSSSFARSK